MHKPSLIGGLLRIPFMLSEDPVCESKPTPPVCLGSGGPLRPCFSPHPSLTDEDGVRCVPLPANAEWLPGDDSCSTHTRTHTPLSRSLCLSHTHTHKRHLLVKETESYCMWGSTFEQTAWKSGTAAAASTMVRLVIGMLRRFAHRDRLPMETTRNL